MDGPEIHKLCEEIHTLINAQHLETQERMILHCMLVADTVASIDCRDCRQVAARQIKEKVLPHYLNQAVKAPVHGSICMH